MLNFYAIGMILEMERLQRGREQAKKSAFERAATRDRSARVMPRIRRAFNVTDAAHEWVCSDRSDCYAIGWGETREAAYEQWLSRFAACRRSREQ